MKFFIILSLAFAQVIGAEIFYCTYSDTLEIPGERERHSFQLEAVYLDGILRGRMTHWYDMELQPVLGNTPNDSGYIVAESDGVVIKSVPGYIRRYAGKRPEWRDDTDIYPYFYIRRLDTFYMPLSKNELRAIQYTDDSGGKCLNLRFSEWP